MPHKRRKARRNRPRRPPVQRANGNGEDGGAAEDNVIAPSGGNQVIEHEVANVVEDVGELAIEDNDNEGLARLPPEMWMKVLSILDFYPNFEMVTRRLVCKTWRNVIDGQMTFQVTLNEKKIDVGTVMSHIRAKSCVVVSLLKPIRPYQLVLSEPEKLKKLCLWGPISAKNMIYFAKRFLNVDDLHFNASPFARRSRHDSFLVPTRKEDITILTNWLGHLEKMEFSFIYCNQVEHPCMSPSYQNLLSRVLPELKTLVIGIDIEKSSYDTAVDDVVKFVARNPSIKTLSLQIQSNEIHHDNINTQLNHRYQEILLDTLKLRFDCPVEFRRFIPLIQRQTNLKELRIIFRLKVCYSFNLPVNVLPHVEWNEILGTLAETIRQNSLESLEVYNFHIRTIFDMAPFQGLRNLKKLILTKSNLAATTQSRVINLDLLPITLESLKLTNLECSTCDLERFLNNASNLKYLELDPAGEVDGVGIYPNGLRSLFHKRTMKRASFKRMARCRFNVQTINGQDYITLDEFTIQIKNFYSVDIDF